MDKLGKKKLFIKIAIDYVVALAIFLFVVICLPKLIAFFLPFVIGFVISVIANPIVKILEKRVRIIRKHSSAIIIALVICLVVFIIYWLGSILVEQAMDMANDMPDTIVMMKEQVSDIAGKFKKIYDKMPKIVKGYIDRFKARITLSGSVSDASFSIDMASTAVKSVADIAFSIIFSILSAYFFTAERDKLAGCLNKYIPKVINERINMIYSYFTTAVGGYFKAQFKLMLILIAIMFVTFEVMGINYSFLISLGIGVLDFLPVFGTGFVLWPWAAYELLIGNYSRGIAFVILYVVCQLIKQFLQPKVVGDSIGISPMTTLVLLFFGYKIGGLIGILIALPVGMIIINLYRAGTFDILVDDTKYLIAEISAFCKENRIKKEKQQ